MGNTPTPISLFPSFKLRSLPPHSRQCYGGGGEANRLSANPAFNAEHLWDDAAVRQTLSLKRVVGYLFLSDGTPSHRQGPPVKTWSG